MAFSEVLKVTAIAYPTIFVVMIVFFIMIKVLGNISPGAK